MKKNGFTLLEVLLALTLLIFFILGTAQIILHSFQLNRKAETMMIMANLGFSKLEFLKSQSFDSESLNAGSYEETLRAANSEEVFGAEWLISDLSEKLKRVELKVFPTSGPHTQIRQVLYLSRDLGF